MLKLNKFTIVDRLNMVCGRVWTPYRGGQIKFHMWRVNRHDRQAPLAQHGRCMFLRRPCSFNRLLATCLPEYAWPHFRTIQQWRKHQRHDQCSHWTRRPLHGCLPESARPPRHPCFTFCHALYHFTLGPKVQRFLRIHTDCTARFCDLKVSESERCLRPCMVPIQVSFTFLFTQFKCQPCAAPQWPSPNPLLRARRFLQSRQSRVSQVRTRCSCVQHLCLILYAQETHLSDGWGYLVSLASYVRALCSSPIGAWTSRPITQTVSKRTHRSLFYYMGLPEVYRQIIDSYTTSLHESQALMNLMCDLC